MRHDDPRLEPADLFRGHTEQHEVGVVTVETAVTVHHVGIHQSTFRNPVYVHCSFHHAYGDRSPGPKNLRTLRSKNLTKVSFVWHW